MTFAAAVGAVVLFAALFQRLPITRHCQNALAAIRQAMHDLSDPANGDDAKEAAARAASIRLFVLAAIIGGLSLLAALPGVAVIGLLIVLGVVDPAALADVFVSWPFAGAAVIVFLSAFLVRKR